METKTSKIKFIFIISAIIFIFIIVIASISLYDYKPIDRIRHPDRGSALDQEIHDFFADKGGEEEADLIAEEELSTFFIEDNTSMSEEMADMEQVEAFFQ